MTLPTIGILALAGAGLGIHLGKASVSEISPHFFSDPPTRFHADLSPARSGLSDAYAARPAMADGGLLGTGCIGCRDFPEEYYPQHDPAVDAPETSYSEPQPAVQLAAFEEQPPEELALHRAKVDQVRRYAGLSAPAQEPASQPPPADEASAVQGDEILPSD